MNAQSARATLRVGWVIRMKAEALVMMKRNRIAFSRMSFFDDVGHGCSFDRDGF